MALNRGSFSICFFSSATRSSYVVALAGGVNVQVEGSSLTLNSHAPFCFFFLLGLIVIAFSPTTVRPSSIAT